MAGEKIDVKNIRLVSVEGCGKKWLTKASSLLGDMGHEPIWLDSNLAGSQSEGEDLFYVLETFDNDCYRRLHGNSNKSYTVVSARAIVELSARDFFFPHKLRKCSMYSTVMLNMSVTFTSIARDERTRLREMVKLMGGEATGDLTLKTTHLICGEVKSLKYKIAAKANIPIILPSWVDYIWKQVTTQDRIFVANTEDILSNHSCGVFQGLVICVTGLDASRRKEIQILSQKHGGTYSGEMKRDDCTHLLVEKPEGQKYLFAKKWQLSTVHPSWFFDSISAGICLPEDGYEVSSLETNSSAPSSSQPWAVALSEFKPQPDMGSQILMQCKIYLSDFPKVHAEKLSNLIQLLGASRLKQLNSSVTHAIVGQEDQEEMKKLLKFRSKLKFVRVEWLLECAAACKHVDESNFTVDIESSLPQSLRDMQPTRAVAVALDEEDDIMKLYDDVKPAKENALGHVLDQKVVYVNTLIAEDRKEQIGQLVSRLGGTVTLSPLADFVVVPLFISPADFDVAAGQGIPITICWLESLEETGKLVSPDSHFLYRPIRGEKNPICLDCCTLYVSQYGGLERRYLQSLAMKLGGRCSKDFHRDCTQLILKEPTGEKYKASLKWDIPTVTDSWLFSCATSGYKVPEEDHLVSLKAQQSVLHSKPSANAETNIITPFKPIQPSLSTTGVMHALQMTSALSQDPANTQQLGTMFAEALAEIKPKDEDQIVPNLEDAARPLKNVVVFVNKKLVRIQAELHTIVTDLGGSYQWTLEPGCTHYIYQGKKGDVSKIKEPRQAKRDKCHIVSPQWIYSCSEAKQRLDENQFPCTYKRSKTSSTLNISTSTQSKVDRSVQLGKQEQDLKKIGSDEIVEDVVEMAVDEGSNAEIVHVDSTNESNTLQTREDFKEQMEEMNKNWQTSKKRRRILGPTERFTGESRRPHTRTSLASSSSKRRKISGSDEDSNSLDNCVRWDTSSQTVTYENPLAKTGQEEILALIRNAETSEFQEENDHAEVPCVDEPSDKNVQDDMINPSSPSLVAPIVTKGDSSANRSGQVMYEDRDQILGMRTRPPQKKFMFSSIPTELRVSLGALVSELGGHDVDAQYFNPSCTHVIVGKASRNEKYLSSVAAGKWVLHMSYLEACREAGKFVDEEPHEWGTMVSGKQPTALEEAARKWRLALTEKRKTLGPKAGAFNGWKILLAVDGNRLSGMKRLLEAGSAEVLGVRTPFPQYSEATHAFVDLSKLSKLTVDKGTVRKWIEVGVNCYKPDFIAEYLMHEDKVDEKLHVISQQELS